MILLIENNIRGGISSVMADRYVKSDHNKKILYVDANNLYGHQMCQPLPIDETKFEDIICSKEILNTLDDNEIVYFLEVDLGYLYFIRQKTKHFPFCPEKKSISKDDFNDYMKKIQPKIYVSHSKLICDRTDKKKNLIHYRMLDFFVRHGMIFDKVQEIRSFKQSKCL